MLYVLAAGLLLVAVVLLALRPLLVTTRPHGRSPSCDVPVAAAGGTAPPEPDDDIEAAIAERRARMGGAGGGSS